MQKSFDPFADAGQSTFGAGTLEDIKFDTVPIPEPQLTFSKSAEPRIETEGQSKVEEKRDPGDLWAKKELFNLNNLSKSKQSKLEIHKDGTADKYGLGNGMNVKTSGLGGSNSFDNGQFSAPIGGAFPTTFGENKAPATKEDKLSALESAFGSSAHDEIRQTHQIQPQVQPKPQPVSSGFGASNDDFGEFPSMFGGSSDGFGQFKGFEGDAFGDSSNQDVFGQPSVPKQPTQQAKPAAPSQPKQEKKDDWFEF